MGSKTLGVPTFARWSATQASQAEAVLLVSPPATHRPLAEVALAAGMHVISEKPLAPTMADARAIVETARASRKRRDGQPELPVSPAVRELAGLSPRLLGTSAPSESSSAGTCAAAGSPRATGEADGASPDPDMAIHHVDMVR